MALRKALFSKPAWAAKSPEPFESDDPPSIFQQNVYEDILQEQRKKQERKAAKQREKDDLRRKKENEGQGTRGDDDGRAVKKRRISDAPINLEQEEEEEQDHDFDEVPSGSESDSSSTKNRNSYERNNPVVELEPEGLSSKSTKQKTRDQTDGSKSGSSTRSKTKAISVDDEDDDELIIYDIAPPTKSLSVQPTKPKSKPRPPPPPESESESEEDEYLKELKRKAREDANTKNLQATTNNAGTKQTLRSLRSPTQDSPDPDNPTTTSASPPVQIYITTILPNCNPIGIIRRPSQTLESVHTHFCTTHNLSDNLRPKIFFTWNNQKLFKSTTTRSILEQLRRKHGSDKSEGKIVLEAVTDEIYEHRLKQREDAKRRAEEDADNNDHDEAGDNNGAMPASGQDQYNAITAGTDPSAPPTATGTKSAGVVIKLTSATPDLPTMSLRVHAHTAIDRIVRGYKSRMNVDPAREVYLVFDGDKLGGDQTVGDVGFEDGDCVDVRCK